MKLILDTSKQTLEIQDAELSRALPLYSDEAFAILSREWLRVGWNQRYTYTFSWMGRPIIQLPEDMIRAQEAIYAVQPDVIIETGVAHGGSLIYSASLCKILGRGRVIGIDIEIRPHNRQAIESHPLASFIQLIEGSSTDPAVVRRVHDCVKPGEKVLVILDSCHTRAHVLAELEAYQDLVSVGSFIVATDGIMRDLHDVPRGQPEWTSDHPAQAAQDFLSQHPEFELSAPARLFNESTLTLDITHWPDSWLRRRGTD